MSRITITICLLLIAGTAHAEMLAQFTWNNTDPVGDYPARYALGNWAVVRNSPSAGWETYVETPTATFVADAATVEAFEDVWTANIQSWTSIYFHNGAAVHPSMAHGGISLDSIFNNSGWEGWEGQRLVPKLGIGLYGYDFDGMERVVTPTSHTIKIYGRPLTFSDADLNSDGTVDAADFVLIPKILVRDPLYHNTWTITNRSQLNWWRQHFGQEQSALQTDAIPEPSLFTMSIILCGIGVSILFYNYRTLRR